MGNPGEELMDAFSLGQSIMIARVRNSAAGPPASPAIISPEGPRSPHASQPQASKKLNLRRLRLSQIAQLAIEQLELVI